MLIARLVSATTLRVNVEHLPLLTVLATYAVIPGMALAGDAIDDSRGADQNKHALWIFPVSGFPYRL